MTLTDRNRDKPCNRNCKNNKPFSGWPRPLAAIAPDAVWRVREEQVEAPEGRHDLAAVARPNGPGASFFDGFPASVATEFSAGPLVILFVRCFKFVCVYAMRTPAKKKREASTAFHSYCGTRLTALRYGDLARRPVISLASTYETDCETLPDLRRKSTSRMSYFGMASIICAARMVLILCCSLSVSSRSTVTTIEPMGAWHFSRSSYPSVARWAFTLSSSSPTAGIAWPTSMRKVASYSYFIRKRHLTMCYSEHRFASSLTTVFGKEGIGEESNEKIHFIY